MQGYMFISVFRIKMNGSTKNCFSLGDRHSNCDIHHWCVLHSRHTDSYNLNWYIGDGEFPRFKRFQRSVVNLDHVVIRGDQVFRNDPININRTAVRTTNQNTFRAPVIFKPTTFACNTQFQLFTRWNGKVGLKLNVHGGIFHKTISSFGHCHGADVSVDSFFFGTPFVFTYKSLKTNKPNKS